MLPFDVVLQVGALRLTMLTTDLLRDTGTRFLAELLTEESSDALIAKEAEDGTAVMNLPECEMPSASMAFQLLELKGPESVTASQYLSLAQTLIYCGAWGTLEAVTECLYSHMARETCNLLLQGFIACLQKLPYECKPQGSLAASDSQVRPNIQRCVALVQFTIFVSKLRAYSACKS